MTASNTLFDSRGGFSGSSYPMNIAEMECLRVVVKETNFETIRLRYVVHGRGCNPRSPKPLKNTSF